MNIVLFTEEEIGRPLAMNDERGKHLLRILKLKEGSRFLAGIIGGTAGWGRIEAIGGGAIRFAFDPDPGEQELCKRYPVTLLVGHPRPPVARRILKDAATMGVERVFMPGTELGEKSYVQSKLWRDGLYRHALVEGASQGRTTLLPEARAFYSLHRCLEELPGDACRIALDHVEPELPLAGAAVPEGAHLVLAIGPERGWTAAERALLKEAGFLLCGMGPRVLRTETAAVAGLALIMSVTGRW